MESNINNIDENLAEDIVEESAIEKNNKLNKWHRWHTITNIIMLVLLIGLMIYLFINIEQVKLLASDVCKICSQKTGTTCWKVMLQ